MLRVSFSPAPECVVADCWNRAYPTPPCHQATVIIIIIVVVVLYQKNFARIKNPDDFLLDLGDFVLDLRFSENPIITTLKYFGPKVNLSESYWKAIYTTLKYFGLVRNMSGPNSFLAYTNELSSIGTEILILELNMCLPYKNYTFFNKSGRFPDLLDEI